MRTVLEKRYSPKGNEKEFFMSLLQIYNQASTKQPSKHSSLGLNTDRCMRSGQLAVGGSRSGSHRAQVHSETITLLSFILYDAALGTGVSDFGSEN